MELTEITQQIEDLISRINFNTNVDFNELSAVIEGMVGSKPSIMPKWEVIKTSNEDLLLDGSNKTIEKVTKLNIVYLNEKGLPINLNFLV